MDHQEYRNRYPVPKEQCTSESSEEVGEQENRGKIELFTPAADRHDESVENQLQQEEQIVLKDQK